MENNNSDDQKARSWGEKIIQDVKDALGINPREEVKDPEDTVKKLRKRKGRA